MRYVEELWETFTSDWLNILATSLIVWALLPVIALSIFGVLLLLQILSLDAFTNAFTNAILPWWVSILINFKKFLAEYIVVTIFTLLLIHHEILESLTLRNAWEILTKNA